MPTASISGQGTTYTLPNFNGELIATDRDSNPFLNMIMGDNPNAGVVPTYATEFEWQTNDIRAGVATAQALEGAPAGNASNRVRSNVSNVLEIHQSPIEVSYSRMASTAMRNGVNVVQGGTIISNELAWQIEMEIKGIKRDLNASMLNGTYNKPANNSQARRTRGLIPAILTNKITATGTLNKAMIDGLFLQCATNYAQFNAGTVLLMNAATRQAVQNIYTVPSAGQVMAVASRNVAGFALDQIITQYGAVAIATDNAVPAGNIVFANLDELRVRALELVDDQGRAKGTFFYESLAKVGSAERGQLYGEFGLEYGAESHHGLLTGFTV